LHQTCDNENAFSLIVAMGSPNGQATGGNFLLRCSKCSSSVCGHSEKEGQPLLQVPIVFSIGAYHAIANSMHFLMFFTRPALLY
jgi:hypothetical protein